MAKKETYQETLKDPRWIKRRNEILSRDKNTCQFCGAQDRYLHIHHKLYDSTKKPWEYDDTALVCVCEKCHEQITNISRDLYDVFIYTRDSLREYGFSDAVLYSLLYRIGWRLKSIRKGDYTKTQWFEDAIDEAVSEIRYYEDVKTLAKMGMRHQAFVDSQFPMFSKDYGCVEKNNMISEHQE